MKPMEPISAALVFLTPVAVFACLVLATRRPWVERVVSERESKGVGK